MKRALALLRRIAHGLVGASDYDAYCRHMAAHHPGHLPVDRVSFFRERQQARYGARGGGRCC